MTTNTNGITITFTTAGNYWLENGAGQLDLGECATLEDVENAIDDVTAAGDGTESWDGWSATREDN